MKNQKKILILKHIIYSLLLLILYVLQNAPALFSIRGIKPILLIPIAISIAMFEGEFIGGMYGAVAGLLCDVGGFSLFGYNGFIISLCCIVTGLLVIYLMRCNLTSCLLFSGVTLFLRGSIEFFFAFGMWGYDGVWRLYANDTLPTIFYSILLTPLLFWLIKRIYLCFTQMSRN